MLKWHLSGNFFIIFILLLGGFNEKNVRLYYSYFIHNIFTESKSKVLEKVYEHNKFKKRPA